MKRHYAHLSQTEKTALTVGRKHGKPIVLYIDTKAMHEEGYKFYLRLFQNFSFWNSFLEFSGKTGLLPVFPGAWFKTNRVLEQAHLSKNKVWLADNVPVKYIKNFCSVTDTGLYAY